MQHLTTLPFSSLQAVCTQPPQTAHIKALEAGQVLFMPELAFDLDDTETALIQSDITAPRAKNISYNANNQQVKGHHCRSAEQQACLTKLMARFAVVTRELVDNLLPTYIDALIQGRTSLRCKEAKGRKTSAKKDDNRLHVDAFPSCPLGDKRILRVFANINPHGQDRLWHLGQPFKAVAARFIPRIKPPLPGAHTILKALHITKQRRTNYDHYMLGMHDAMKLDLQYQSQVEKTQIAFPANSMWLVFTDVASHAALSGRHLLEQTFYLPIAAMEDAENSPQMMLSEMLQQDLLQR